MKLQSPQNEFDVEQRRVCEAYQRRSRTVNSSRYTVFDPANLLVLQERERYLVNAIKNTAGMVENLRVLEIGCGTGYTLREMIQWGVVPHNLVGIDILPERLRVAREKCPGAVRVLEQSAINLPFGDAEFEVVVQSTVFSSILSGAAKEQVAAEMIRVLKPHGVVLWYDFCVNNPKNDDVRGVSRAELISLFPNCEFDLTRITLAPPLGRRIARFSRHIYELLSSIPLLCTHYVGTISKKAASS